MEDELVACLRVVWGVVFESAWAKKDPCVSICRGIGAESRYCVRPAVRLNVQLTPARG